jgi:hypothetical protein
MLRPMGLDGRESRGRRGRDGGGVYRKASNAARAASSTGWSEGVRQRGVEHVGVAQRRERYSACDVARSASGRV